MKPGEYDLDDDLIELNSGKNKFSIEVANTGDRPIQIGSHYHFFEANRALKFDREATLGYRLNIPAGTAVRFEPGLSRTVELGEYSGDKKIFGFRGDVMGSIGDKRQND